MLEVGSILYQIKSIWENLTVGDFILPGSFGLWLIVLSIPLKGIDLTDHFSMLNYVGFLSFSGLVLTVVVPKGYELSSNFQGHGISFLLFAFISSARWYRALAVTRYEEIIKRQKELIIQNEKKIETPQKGK